MNRSALASIALAGLVGAVAVSLDGVPAHVPGERRTVTLTPCASDWSAWAQAWCPDGDAACVDANNDRQGHPYCVDGVEVGQCASTPATPSQEARARHLGIALEVPAGWVRCAE